MGGAETTAVAYEFGEYRLAPAQRSLTRAGLPVPLRGKAFETLVYLVEHAGELVERDALIEAVWPKRVVEDNNLNQAIATLRRALGEQHVVTVPGRGYQFVTRVHRSGSGPASALAPGTPSSREHDARAAAPPRHSPQPALVGAAAAGLALVALLAFGPRGEGPSPTLVGAAVTVRPLTTYPGEELTPALSPDGTRVVFSWRPPEGRRALYVTEIGGREPIRLSDPTTGDDAFPAWSPDGQNIAFLRVYDPTRFDVLVMPALGGAARKLFSGDRFSISVEGSPLLAWSPDNRYLVFTALRPGESFGGNYGVYRLAVATGRVDEIELARQPADYDTSLAISPDGRWLAFTRFTRTQRLNAIMLQRLEPGLVPDGAPEAIAEIVPDVYHSLHWSPEGDRLWFSNGSRIFEWAAGSPPKVIHTLGAQFTSPMMAIAAHGVSARAVAVMRHSDTDIFSLALDPVTHAPLGRPQVRAPSTAIDYHPRVSPDGRSLAFVSDRGGSREIWLANLDGSEPRRLTSVGQLVVGYPRWSPDGQSMSVHSSAPGEDRVVYRVDVESGTASRLFNGCCPGGWTADGRSLYVTELGTVSHVARVDLATGTRERLFVGDLAVESADSRFLLYAKLKEPGYFRRPLLETGGVGEETRLVDDYRTTFGGLAPVADGFFYIAFTEEGAARALRFYDYARGEARDLAAVPAGTNIGLSVTPDASQIFYAAIGGQPEADITVVEFSSSDRVPAH